MKDGAPLRGDLDEEDDKGDENGKDEKGDGQFKDSGRGFVGRRRVGVEEDENNKDVEGGKEHTSVEWQLRDQPN